MAKRRKSTTVNRKHTQIEAIRRKTCFLPFEGQRALHPHLFLPIIIMIVVIVAMAIVIAIGGVIIMAIAIVVLMTIVIFLVLVAVVAVFLDLLSVLLPASITSFFS